MTLCVFQVDIASGLSFEEAGYSQVTISSMQDFDSFIMQDFEG